MTTIKKHHIYKMYRGTTYLGLLPQPENEFTFTLDINNAGFAIKMDVPLNIDTAVDTVEPLLTEAGDIITDEAGIPIYIDKQPDVIGNAHETILLRTGNTVKVYEYSNYHPNGKLMFTGKLTSVEAEFGSGSTDKVVATAKSLALDLDNYLIQV
jgi:hypothetical protein